MPLNCGAGEDFRRSLGQQEYQTSQGKSKESQRKIKVKGNQPWKFLEELTLKLKLKLQYFGNLMLRADSLEKSLILGKTDGRRKRE